MDTPMPPKATGLPPQMYILLGKHPILPRVFPHNVLFRTLAKWISLRSETHFGTEQNRFQYGTKSILLGKRDLRVAE